MVKGKKDYRDLSNEAQFYYEKLVKALNDNLILDGIIEKYITYLDNLIDCVKEDMTNYYQSKLDEINKLLDKANDWIDDLENKIEEF